MSETTRVDPELDLEAAAELDAISAQAENLARNITLIAQTMTDESTPSNSGRATGGLLPIATGTSSALINTLSGIAAVVQGAATDAASSADYLRVKVKEFTDIDKSAAQAASGTGAE